MTSYISIDGEETPLGAARMLWQRAVSDNRQGIVFHIAADGQRRLLQVSGWAAGASPRDLTNQVVQLRDVGPDATVDGRFLVDTTIRFGLVTDQRAVLSLDGEAESIDYTSDARSLVESDLRCDVRPRADRRHCLGCGTVLDDWATSVEEYIGGVRVTLRRLPVLCPRCLGKTTSPKHCPTCGGAYPTGSVSMFSDEDGASYTATCREGHTYSGTLPNAAA